MHYLLLIHGNEAAMAAASEADLRPPLACGSSACEAVPPCGGPVAIRLDCQTMILHNGGTLGIPAVDCQKSSKSGENALDLDLAGRD
jgi:hypothetical protein